MPDPALDCGRPVLHSLLAHADRRGVDYRTPGEIAGHMGIPYGDVVDAIDSLVDQQMVARSTYRGREGLEVLRRCDCPKGVWKLGGKPVVPYGIDGRRSVGRGSVGRSSVGGVTTHRSGDKSVFEAKLERKSWANTLVTASPETFTRKCQESAPDRGQALLERIEGVLNLLPDRLSDQGLGEGGSGGEGGSPPGRRVTRAKKRPETSMGLALYFKSRALKISPHGLTNTGALAARFAELRRQDVAFPILRQSVDNFFARTFREIKAPLWRQYLAASTVLVTNLEKSATIETRRDNWTWRVEGEVIPGALTEEERNNWTWR